MAVIFDRNSAKIDIHFDKAKPDIYLLDTQRVHCHLTEGFDDKKICKLGHDDALAAFGNINVSAGPSDFKGWQFGFIQIAKMNNLNSFYAGRTPKEGSIGIQSQIPPALAQTTMLDSTLDNRPWATLKGFPFPPLAPPILKQGMGDHPSACAAKDLRNSNTKLTNFLFHLIYDYEFWTTLSAREPGGSFQHFAHFHWRVHWENKFSWRGGAITKGVSNSSIKPDSVVLGPPADAGIQALLNNPTGPLAIVEINQASWNTRSNTPNRSDNPDWFNNVPRDFFA